MPYRRPGTTRKVRKKNVYSGNPFARLRRPWRERTAKRPGMALFQACANAGSPKERPDRTARENSHLHGGGLGQIQGMFPPTNAGPSYPARNTTSTMGTTPDEARRKAVESLLVEFRPKLHRYCARMTGSVIDGEDVLQEVLVRALEVLPGDQTIENPEGWLIRVAHNAAMDFLRARARHDARHKEESMDTIEDSKDPIRDQQVAATSLRRFMELPVVQRGTV